MQEDQGVGELEAEDYADIFETMALSITSLLETSALIRNNPGRDPWKRIMSLEPWYAQPMVDNAVQRWPKLDGSRWLAERMGLANSRRKQFFQYREDHVKKLENPTQDNRSETVPTTFQGNTQAAVHQDERAGSDEAASETTFATTFGIDDDTRMTIPPQPESHGKPEVECSLCHNVITLRNRRAWKHVRCIILDDAG